MMIRLDGKFSEVPSQWSDIKYLLSLMGRTSIQEIPSEIRSHANTPRSNMPQTWLVLKNKSPKFIRSVSEERNTIDRPYEVTDEMYEMLKDCWFTSIKDLFAYSGGELYTAKMVRNYLSSMMRKEPDISSMVILSKMDRDIDCSANIYMRAWSYFLILNYRKELHEIIRSREKIKQIIALENIL